MKNENIKRVLSIGLVTMTDRLRIYKDPFETSGLELSQATNIDNLNFPHPILLSQIPDRNTITSPISL